MKQVLVLALGAAVASSVLPGAASAQSGGPVAAIGAYDRAINAIETAGLAAGARTDRFAPLVRQYYDMGAIAALVAGPAWAKASAADKADATAALVRHSAVSLARNFKGPSATRFAVDPIPVTRAGATLVKVIAGEGDVLYYRMRGNRIVDVISGGVSQLALQRADIAATVSAGGVPAMTRKLAALDGAK